MQGLVVANEASHCVSFQDGEGFFGMSVHRRCAIGDDSPSLPTHVGIGLVPLPLFRVWSSILQKFHFVDPQRSQRPEADVCAGRELHHATSLQASTRTDSVGRASIAPSFPLFNRFICTKSESGYQKGCLRNQVLACWDKSCRLEGSSEQLLSLAIHLTWNSYLVAETEACQLTYLYQQLEIPSASAFNQRQGHKTCCR